MHIRRFLVFWAAFLFLAWPSAFASAAQWGRLYSIIADVPLFGQPADGAAMTRILKAGTKVIVDPRDGSWGAVYGRQESVPAPDRVLGYVRLSDLRDRGIVEIAHKKGKLLAMEAAARSGTISAPSPESKPEPKAEPTAAERAVKIGGKPAAETGRGDSWKKIPEGGRVSPRKRRRSKRDRDEAEASNRKGDGKAKEKAVRAEKKGTAKKSSESSPPARQERPPRTAKASEGKKKHSVPEFGELRMADRSLMVREKRERTSKVRKILRPGETVRVDFRAGGWYAVFDPAETKRDLSLTWGFSRDKYLLTADDYEAERQGRAKPKTGAERDKTKVAEKGEAEKGTARKQPTTSESAKSPNGKAPAPEASSAKTVNYAVLSRRSPGKAKSGKPGAEIAILRVRLGLVRPPAEDMLREIAHGIWRAEHRKGEGLRLEMLLKGMDAGGLAYAVALFSPEGRMGEFWWRNVVLGKKAK